MVLHEDFGDILGDLFYVLILVIPWLFEKRTKILVELCFQLLLRVNEMTILVLQSQNFVVPPVMYHFFMEKGHVPFPTF